MRKLTEIDVKSLITRAMSIITIGFGDSVVLCGLLQLDGVKLKTRHKSMNRVAHCKIGKLR